MPKVITYTTPEEFISQNREFVLNSPSSHLHLISVIDMLWNKQIGYYEGYNVVDDKGANILCLWVDGNFLIYGDQYTNETIATVAESVKWDKIGACDFAGQSFIITQVLQKANQKYTVIKERIVYECSQLNVDKPSAIGKYESASYQDLDLLADMSRKYQSEEYNGTIDRDLKYYKNMISNTLKNTFVWKTNNIITTIIQILNSEDNIPHLGLLYTIPEYRSNGFATVLTYKITEMVLSSSLKCGLNTDAANVTTNRMVRKIGYEEVYNFINVSRIID